MQEAGTIPLRFLKYLERKYILNQHTSYDSSCILSAWHGGGKHPPYIKPESCQYRTQSSPVKGSWHGKAVTEGV